MSQKISQARLKSVVLLYHLMMDRNFNTCGQKFRLGGDLLDLGIVDKGNPNQLHLLQASFRDFLNVSHSIEDKDLPKLLQVMLEELSNG